MQDKTSIVNRDKQNNGSPVKKTAVKSASTTAETNTEKQVVTEIGEGDESLLNEISKNIKNKRGGQVLRKKVETPVVKLAAKPKAAAPKDSTVSTVKTVFKPYGEFGRHGSNFEVEGYSEGDVVDFTIKGSKVTGELSHFHRNNHSPSGYAVIKYDGKIFERVLSKISKHVTEASAPAGEKATGKKKKAASTQA